MVKTEAHIAYMEERKAALAAMSASLLQVEGGEVVPLEVHLNTAQRLGIHERARKRAQAGDGGGQTGQQHAGARELFLTGKGAEKKRGATRSEGSSMQQ